MSLVEQGLLEIGVATQGMMLTMVLLIVEVAIALVEAHVINDAIMILWILYKIWTENYGLIIHILVHSIFKVCSIVGA